MKLILGIGGGGSGYYPYTQKPADYQPYRPVYTFRGPPPDAGFSYGLFEDPDTQKKYYADLGLDSFSPFSGKPAKLVEEMEADALTRQLGADLEHLTDVECPQCSAQYKQNVHLVVPDRELYCHRCGGRLARPVWTKE